MRQGRVWDCMQPNPPGHVASQNQPPEKWGWANAGSYPPTGWGVPWAISLLHFQVGFLWGLRSFPSESLSRHV